MKRNPSNRRHFLKTSALAMIGGSTMGRTSLAQTRNEKEEALPTIRNYKTLGRTGFQVSDIGSGAPMNEPVLKALIDAGVNYMDTGEGYYNGKTDRVIGNVIKDYDRKKFFIATKLLNEDFFSSKEDVLNRVRQSLERLGTDYVDCCMIHSVENSNRLKDEHWHAAMDQLKSEGRVRSTGLSCHGSAWLLEPEDSLEKVMMTAIDDGRFDVFMMTHNYLTQDVTSKILDACKEKNIGTAIIKSNPVMLYQLLDGAVTRLENEGKDAEGYRNWRQKFDPGIRKGKEYFGKYGYDSEDDLIAAGITYIVSDPRAHTVCLDFKNLESVEAWLGRSGTRFENTQAKMLDDYRQHFGFLNCRMGCNACESACPHHLPVNNIMRYHYYFHNKRQEKEAMKLYAGIDGARATVCRDCEAPCEDACPYGVHTRGLMALAHDHLSFDHLA
jgi:predicted aldo/keto reductase-like oxidoreductase